MKDPAPSVSPSTPINVVIDMIKFFPPVLVSEKGKIMGIITKSDIINKL